MISNAVLDIDFINELLCQTEREVFARVTVLNQREEPLEFIEGKATGGSINVDGKSAIRRSCSLTMVADELYINDFYWGVRNKFKLEVGLTNNVNDKYENIIWFPQGIYLITNFDTNLAAKKWTVSIKGKDKMCLLNGEFGGHLPHNTEFGIEKYHDLKTDTVTKTPIPIKTIIREAVRNFGGEQPQNIIINDLEEVGKIRLEYRGNTPMYMFRKIEDDIFTNVSFNANQTCYYFGSTGWIKTTIGDSTNIIYDNLVDLDGEIEPTKIKFHNNEIFEQLYYIAKFDYGSIPGYRLTDLTYEDPESLVSKAGDTVVSLLDKIKKMLVNFEYFYNVEGKFVFQKQQKYNAFNWQGSEIDEVLYADATLNMEQPIFSFLDDKLLTSFKNTPKLQDLKNDFSIHGIKRSPSGAENPIRARYAIDKKPTYYRAYDGMIYTTNEHLIDDMITKLKEKLTIELTEKLNKFELKYTVPIDLPAPIKQEDGSYSAGWWDIRDWYEYYQLVKKEIPNRTMKWYSKNNKEGCVPLNTIPGYEYRTGDVWLVIKEKDGRYNVQHGSGQYSETTSHQQCYYSVLDDSLKGYSTYPVSPAEYGDFHAPYSGCTVTHTYLEFLKSDVEAKGGLVYFYNPNFPNTNSTQEAIDKEIEKEVEIIKKQNPMTYVDWREIIYQMALDYNKHYHDDDFLYQVAQNNKDYYPYGQTGYERYYVDINGFWRTLYDPNPTPMFEAISYLEAPEHYQDETLYIQHSYRKLEMDEKDELVVDITKLYVLDYNRDPEHPDIIPFLGSQYCRLRTPDEEDSDLYFYVDPQTNIMNSGETNPYKLNQINLAEIYLKNRGPFITNESTFIQDTSVNKDNYVRGRYYLKTFKEGYYLYNDAYRVDLQYYIEDNKSNDGYSKVDVGRDVYESGKYFEKVGDQYKVVKTTSYDKNKIYYKLQFADFEPVTITSSEYNRNTYFVFVKELEPDEDGYVEIIYKPATSSFNSNTQYYQAINAKYIQISFSEKLFEPNKYYVWKDAKYSLSENEYNANMIYYSPSTNRKHYYVKQDDTGANAGLGGESKYQYWVFKYPFGTNVGDYYDDYTNYAALQLEKYLEEYQWDNLYIQTEGHIKFQDLDLDIQRLYYKQAGILTEYLTNPQYDNYNIMKTIDMEITYGLYGLVPNNYKNIEDYQKAIQDIQKLYIEKGTDFILIKRDEEIARLDINDFATAQAYEAAVKAIEDKYSKYIKDQEANIYKIYNQDLVNELWLLNKADYNSTEDYLEAVRTKYDSYITSLRNANKDILKELILSYQQVHYKKAIYNYKRDPEHADFWSYTISNSPEDLVFWFDFINGETSYLSKYSVQAIGPRSKVVNDKNVKSIYYKEVPNTIFIDTLQEKEKYEYQSGYTYIQLNKGMLDSLFYTSTSGKSAKEALDDVLYTNSYATENATIQATPIYHLQPNSRIYIRNDDTNINGEYLISKITVPLDHKKMMSITATKVIPSII